jgi:calcineurin-like phosphoesterase family protein
LDHAEELIGVKVIVGTVAVFFTADTHFRDPRRLRLDRRPFESIVSHDESLIRRWNDVVASADMVWHLGDFARGKAETITELLSVLNGAKHLIAGNGDRPETLCCPLWASVQHYAELMLDDHMLVLCHYPFRTWNKMGRGSLNLHGHSHGKLKPFPRQYDVGVDACGYVPVRLEQLLGLKVSRSSGLRARR